MERADGLRIANRLMDSNRRYKFELSFVILLVCATVVSFVWARPDSAADGLLHVYFLDVGQGDAMLVQTPNGNQMLIDGGPDTKILARLGGILPLKDRDLDVIVATHTDADHLSGLVDVLKRYTVDHIVETGMKCATAICGQWEELAGRQQSSRVFARAGYTVSLDDEVQLQVLNPLEDISGQVVKKTNNAGIVLKLTYRNQTMLFAADIEKSVEDALLRRTDVDVDFLKIAHHGSKTSSTQNFLAATTPNVAFIEVGAKNRYGHPTPEVLDRLDKNGILYYRTDKDGTTELILDGTNYSVATYQ